jgi:osmoprotectant transport system permease protein
MGSWNRLGGAGEPAGPGPAQAEQTRSARVRSGRGASERANAIISATGGVIGALTLGLAPFVSFRPNRIVEGDSASAVSALGIAGWVALVLILLAGLAVPALWRRRLRRDRLRGLSGVVRGLLATVALLLVLGETGRVASEFAAGQSPAARTSFGWGFYVFLFALFLVYYSASADTSSRSGRAIIWLAPVVGVVLLAAFGALGELGIIREWSLTRTSFVPELTRHLFYALGATIGAIVFGIPLGIWAARSKRAETAIMGALSLGQVLPVLAFVGIMIPILGSLSDRVPPLEALGISGIGWAPVMVVLFIYALFPVTRNTLVAIQQLDPGVLDSARGMGMGRWRSLKEVELPLAFPVVLAGIRIALVQSTAGAIIAAFVGGGGLGTIMFTGLEQTSMDLVLVGVIPIVALALFFDTLLRGVERLSTGGRAIDPNLSGL